jgi:hypothetical protein
VITLPLTTSSPQIQHALGEYSNGIMRSVSFEEGAAKDAYEFHLTTLRNWSPAVRAVHLKEIYKRARCARRISRHFHADRCTGWARLGYRQHLWLSSSRIRLLRSRKSTSKVYSGSFFPPFLLLDPSHYSLHTLLISSYSCLVRAQLCLLAPTPSLSRTRSTVPSRSLSLSLSPVRAQPRFSFLSLPYALNRGFSLFLTPARSTALWIRSFYPSLLLNVL